MSDLTPFLQVTDLRVEYDGTQILHGVSLTLGRGQVMAVLGANGSGKSTLFNAISGIKRPITGDVRFNGRAVGDLKPHDVLAMGISHVLERQRSFPYLSVRDNLLLGGHILSRAERQRRMEECIEVFPLLRGLADRLTKDLSGGERQLVAIARGLMTMPKLLILDEPFMGLTPMMVSEVLRIIAELREKGVSVMFCEHRIQQAVEISDTVVVMAGGRVALLGDGSELSDTRKIREIYLGHGNAPEVHASHSGS